MANTPAPFMNRRKDWGTAIRAMRTLLADPNDTAQVFRIMMALNTGTAADNYHRLLRTPEGGRLAYERVELAGFLSDPAFLARFGSGTVGAAYRDFLARTGHSAMGLASISEEVAGDREMAHPYAWFGRRERDIHDVWHVLTGYSANEPLGELCHVAFSYAQTKGLGWGFIALMGVLKHLREPYGREVARAAWEGYRNGRAASWLHLENIETLFAEPLDEARRRLKIAKPVAYERVEAKIAAPPSPQLAAA
jgi:ubiquinone biosynthesis protein COQ4